VLYEYTWSCALKGTCEFEWIRLDERFLAAALLMVPWLSLVILLSSRKVHLMVTALSGQGDLPLTVK
jgi:hypothetical protein